MPKKCIMHVYCRCEIWFKHSSINITCPNAYVTGIVIQHGLQSRFEDIRVESYKIVIVQVDDFKFTWEYINLILIKMNKNMLWTNNK